MSSTVSSTVDSIEETTDSHTRLPSEFTSRSIRPILCRKCKEHGVKSFMKGHGSKCPFNDCACERCASVMSKRVSAIIRRYRHASTDCGLLLKPVRYRNGNTRLRVFPKFIDASNDCIQIPNSTDEKRKRHDGRQQSHVTSATNGSRVRDDRQWTETYESCINSSLTSTTQSNHHHVTAPIPPADQLLRAGNIEEVQPLLACSPILTPSISQNVSIADYSADSLVPAVAATAKDCAAESWLIENGRSPVILGQRITCNLLLSLDADRSHPMFWQFVHLVQKLEESMLT